MKWRNRLLLGSAAGLFAVVGAQAADLPVKAKPVDYVRICTAYGAGFYYIPGTDICLRVGGFVYMEAGWNGRSAAALGYSGNVGNDLIINRNDNTFAMRAQTAVILDARAQSAIGTVRTYIAVGANYATNTAGASPIAPSAAVYLERAFIQFAGFTAGMAATFFDFGGFYSILALSSIAWNWNPVFAYTAQFGNGFSATLSFEDPTAFRTKIVQGGAPTWNGQATVTNLYGGSIVPDIIGNLRVDQAWGSAQISGALHQLRVNQTPTTFTNVAIPIASDVWGWAVLGGIEVKTPSIAPGDSIMLQGVYSQGAVEYTGLSASNSSIANGIGLRNPAGIGASVDIWDASTNFVTGALQLTTAWSWNLMFRHFWQPNLRSAFWVGQNRYEPSADIPGFSPGLNMYQAGGNIIWSPAPTLDLSLDVLYTKLEQTSLANCVVLSGICGQTSDIWTVWSRWRRNF